MIRRPLRTVTPDPVTNQPPDREMEAIHVYRDDLGPVCAITWGGEAGSVVQEVRPAEMPVSVRQAFKDLLDELEKYGKQA